MNIFFLNVILYVYFNFNNEEYYSNMFHECNFLTCFYNIHIVNSKIKIKHFSGEPKTSTDTPKRTATADNGTNNNNAHSSIGGVRSLYVLLGTIAAIIGVSALLIFFSVCLYSRRSSTHSNSQGKNIVICIILK